jgi:hypothetical protein
LCGRSGAVFREVFAAQRKARQTAVPPRYIQSFNEEHIMAKGEQRSNKMAKKPKKDSSPPPDSSGTSTRPTPPVTSVMPKGKLKNK